jgi:electron transport complex protein RnfD
MTTQDMTMSSEDRLLLTASPHLKSPDSTPKIMWHVNLSLVPVILVAIYYFGPSAILVMAAAIAGAMGTEYVFGPKKSLWDGSAAITGILLGLCLPAGFPLWMAFLGGAFGVGFGKLVFGGLGQNPFNPALVGRAFLQAAFPTAITTWPSGEMAWGAFRGPNFSIPLLTSEAGADVVTAATPLGLWKFEGEITELLGLVIGRTGASPSGFC